MVELVEGRKLFLVGKSESSKRNVQAAERKAAYLEWLLTPESERSPRLKGELAVRLGVSLQQLRNYVKDATFQFEYQKRLRELNRVDRAPTILAGLYARAQGKGAAANQAAKILLDWMAREDSAAPPVDLTSVSDEELFELANRLVELAHE